MGILDFFSQSDINCIDLENLTVSSLYSCKNIEFNVDVITTGIISSVTIDYGDGTTEPMTLLAGNTYESTHLYISGGGFTVKIIVQLTTGETNEKYNEWYNIIIIESESCPNVSNVNITGTCERFETLTINYIYEGASPEGATVFQWFRRLPPSSTWLPILGADQQNYVLTPDDVDYEVIGTVQPVSNIGEIGNRVFAINSCIVAAGAFMPYDIPNSLSILDFTNSSTVITDMGVPERILTINDSNYFTAYHWDSVGSVLAPRYDTPNVATFVAADLSVISPVNSNVMPISVGSDITIIFLMGIDSSLGAGNAHIHYETVTANRIQVINTALRVRIDPINYDSAPTAFVDDVIRVHVLRSGSMDGFDWSVNGVGHLANAAHLLNYDISNFLFSRTAAPFIGEVKAVHFINRRISDAERTQLINYYQSLP